MRWSEDQYRAYVTRGQPDPLPALTEAVWQSAVRRIAKDAGYTFAYHTYRSTRSPSGFPDLILCHKDPGHVCYAVELKTDVGQVTPAQQAWLTALAGCTGVVAEIWRPSDMAAMIERLRG